MPRISCIDAQFIIQVTWFSDILNFEKVAMKVYK